ncbi:hypothetical protein GSH19_04570 [Lactobacillus sp. S2-2]|uniref:cadmium resistance transporter n=1 Tax=Lactobacillus sp. S2-2 TaxID=2692917 RepID=UPI001F4531E7|nr:cadmium resistance transporter [Lactobacillus sp. S2-2]MCF6515425.1 hypothetical protein [Lactobacillus sp. S2-2]
MENLPLITMLFIGVNLDFFVVLLFLLQKFSFKNTLFGYELGMIIIFIISALLGQFIQNIIPEWSIGLLGLIPIYMGIKGENNEDNKNTNSKKGILAVILIYFASCGSDNLSVYIPVLATMNLNNILITIVYFIILTFISLVLATYVCKIPIIHKIFEKWGGPISQIIYILIGIFVMLETGLIQKIISLF